MKATIIISSEYAAFLTELKGRVASARLCAGRAVNRELILLYWDIGRGIVEKQQTLGWGDAVVEMVAADLRRAFPQMTGFSPRNVWDMRRLYSTYTAAEFLAQAAREIDDREAGQVLRQAVAEFGEGIKRLRSAAKLTDVKGIEFLRQLVAEIHWGHNLLILNKLTHPASRLYYLRATARFGWTRDVLLNQLKAGAYERAVTEKKTHNFELALPEHLAEQADEMLKSRYNLEFLGIARPMKERELEDRLVGRLQQFILELGYGFCFVGRQYRLALGQKEYFVDLLFYHRFLKALVAFDLKLGEFQPEHAGKMDFYLHPVRYIYYGPILLCLHPPEPERRRLLHRLHARSKTPTPRASDRKREINRPAIACRTRLLRSVPQSARRYPPREVSQNRLGEALPQDSNAALSNGVNLLNEKERAPDDRPSIGIILCAEKDDVEVEFALKTKTNPIGVAEYQLQSRLPAEFKGKLPTAKQLADVVRSVLPEQKQK